MGPGEGGDPPQYSQVYGRVEGEGRVEPRVSPSPLYLAPLSLPLPPLNAMNILLMTPTDRGASYTAICRGMGPGQGDSFLGVKQGSASSSSLLLSA